MRCSYCGRPTPKPDERPGSRYTSDAKVVCERATCFITYAVHEARVSGVVPGPKTREERAVEDENQSEVVHA